MKGRKCAVIYSGGKDSHLAFMLAVQSGYRISCLITIDGGKNHFRFFNDLNKLNIIKKQSEIMNLPLFVYKAGGAFKPQEYVQNYSTFLKEARKKYDFNCFCSGTTEDSDEYKALREVSKETGVKLFAPLSGMKLPQVIARCRALRIEALIVGVEKNVSQKWLNRTLDTGFAEYVKKEYEKKSSVDANSFQTLVFASPLLRKKMVVSKSRILDKGDCKFLEILKYGFRARRKTIAAGRRKGQGIKDKG